MMQEENNNYFKSALADFAFDAACGAQIRHLADLGYTVKQIMGELDFSISYKRVQETVTEYLAKKGMLLFGKPDGKHSFKKEFVREYDGYGRVSFRQVKAEENDIAEIHWQERTYESATDGTMRSFLNRKTAENGEEFSYISCDFGLNKQKTAESLKALEPFQQEYIQGILWEKSRMYHRLTPNMRAIIARLYEQGLYEGECYFKKTEEHIIL